MFNRPDLVKQTFPQIKAQQPKQLFVAADGPRVGNDDDVLKCEECRTWVMAQIDWECEVQTLFREKNLGCGLAVGGAISWFFGQVEMGVILEDDVFVKENFFDFTERLLWLYKDSKEVHHIGGINFIPRNKMKEDYYFSSIVHVWGWATWRNSWALYDYELIQKLSSEEIDLILLNLDFGKEERSFWNIIFKRLKDDEIDTWDYRWFLSLWKNSGLSIVPKENLVLNIGDGDDSTHTKTLPQHKMNSSWYMSEKIQTIPLKRSGNFDKELFLKVLNPKSTLLDRIRNMKSKFFHKVKGNLNLSQ